MSFHNMRVFFERGAGAGAEARSVAFDSWLREAVRGGSAATRAALEGWAAAPSARFAHPREEQLLPLMVAFGASGEAPGEAIFGGDLLGAQILSFAFGGGCDL
jgi:aromatic ring-opening dioxygenase catalytic subunit (LigB family)